MKLKYSESHPLKSYLVNEAYITKDEFVEKFKNFDWEGLLKVQLAANDKQIHFSPSINLDDKDGKGIAASIVGELNEYEFYVCYKRPITRKKTKWFGLVSYDFYDKDFFSVITEQTKKDAFDAFLFFYDRNFEELEKRW
ncbi:MAG: hypothetical protein AB8B65_08580 [Kordia sp.]|uniref:hypothetical protein n=1 Tax=Kordia sp. TaxID=1965332 RepID=UPI00385EEE05